MPPPARRPTVLIVEDDVPLRDMYRSALKVAGYEVGGVDDGLDALRWIEEHTPDAIVLDLILPRLGGRDVHSELQTRAETRSIPIVIVTGDDAADIPASELCVVLQKPVEPHTLVDTVSRCIRRHGRAV